LQSDTIEDVSRNVDVLKEWVANWSPKDQWCFLDMISQSIYYSTS
jgi:hypothetical protein